MTLSKTSENILANFRIIVLTANAMKLYFLKQSHFLFLSHLTIGAYVFAQLHKTNDSAKSKKPIFPNSYKEKKITSINFKLNNYGNN